MKYLVLLLFFVSCRSDPQESAVAESGAALIPNESVYSKAGDSSFLVTGHFIYRTGYDYQLNENVSIGFRGKWLHVDIDSITPAAITALLTSTGVDPKTIIYIDAVGSSKTNDVEIFFAFQGRLPQEREDIWLRNSYHNASLGYAGNRILYVPQFQRINKPEMLGAIEYCARYYDVTSFMVKPWSSQNVAFLVLSRAPRNGVLADMRNAANSVRLVPYFKELNWSRIWYQEAGIQKVVVRPAAGW